MFAHSTKLTKNTLKNATYPKWKKKTKRISSHFHQFFKIQTNYNLISPNISVANKASNISKQPEKYIQTTYAGE